MLKKGSWFFFGIYRKEFGFVGFEGVLVFCAFFTLLLGFLIVYYSLLSSLIKL